MIPINVLQTLQVAICGTYSAVLYVYLNIFFNHFAAYYQISSDIKMESEKR